MVLRWLVLTKAGELMRPYQIYAVKSIVESYPPELSLNGYIWHTTGGSGKTLTSFEASTLLKK
jgi:type I restriction enzyme R subunit